MFALNVILTFLLPAPLYAEQDTVLQDPDNREEFLELKGKAEKLKKKVAGYTDILKRNTANLPAAETEEEKAHPEIGRRARLVRKLAVELEKDIPLLQEQFDRLVEEAENVYFSKELHNKLLARSAVERFKKEKKRLFDGHKETAKKLSDLAFLVLRVNLSLYNVRSGRPPRPLLEKEIALEAALFPPETPP